MSESPWQALRMAEEAVASHRPDEAHRLIEPLIAEGYGKAKKLAREVVRAYVSRAHQQLDLQNPEGAWLDLLAAEALNTGEKGVAELRQTLTRLGLSEVRAALEAGNPSGVVATVARLRGRGVRHPELDRYESVAQEWVAAIEVADAGEFPRALALLDNLRPRLTSPATGFDRFRAELEGRYSSFKTAVGKLYDAAESRRWREVVMAAEEVLAVAPEHRETKVIRGRAWLAALPGNDESAPVAGSRPTAAFTPGEPRPVPSASAGLPVGAPSAAAGPSPLPKRFLLWVDGVGGYLVCLANRVTLGQAAGDGPVDVPLFAELSRLHAEISRDGEGYVIESGKGVLVNGQRVTRAVLSAGDRVTLGTTCQFLFHKPVSVSGTARLELTSGHRLPVAVDGILLMANELLLGPGPHAHVILPGPTAPVSIYRSREGLAVRVPHGSFRIDEQLHTDRATLPLPSVVSGELFTFAVEPVTGRL